MVEYVHISHSCSSVLFGKLDELCSVNIFIKDMPGTLLGVSY